MYPRQNIPGGRKTEKGLLHETRNGREKCESPYFYAFFGRFVPGKAFSNCINYCVFIEPAACRRLILYAAFQKLTVFGAPPKE